MLCLETPAVAMWSSGTLVIVQSYAQLGYLDHDKQIYWMIQITNGTRSLSHLPIVVQPRFHLLNNLFRLLPSFEIY